MQSSRESQGIPRKLATFCQKILNTEQRLAVQKTDLRKKHLHAISPYLPLSPLISPYLCLSLLITLGLIETLRAEGTHGVKYHFTKFCELATTH